MSGSGKSTLINQTLFQGYLTKFQEQKKRDAKVFKKLSGINDIDKIIEISQSPIGRTPRSNPATYTGLFTPLKNYLLVLKSQDQELQNRKV